MMKTCWEYLAEALRDGKGCACGHTESRHYLRITGQAIEYMAYGAIVAPFVVDQTKRCGCSLCACTSYRWDRQGRMADGTIFTYDTAVCE